MIDRLKQKRNEQGGFTLIELLIVVIVLAILAAIVVFALGSTRSDSVHSACATSEKSVELSAEALNTKNGAYPIADFTAAIPADSANPLVATPTNGALLKSYPTSNDYSLRYVSTDGKTFQVNVFKGTTTTATADSGAKGCGEL
jgi:general secretion pathway protein G